MIIINYECDHCQHFNQFNIIKTQPLECNQCKNNFGTIDLDWDYNSNCLFCNNNGFYKRKNFNQLIGLLIIVLGGLLTIWLYDTYGPLSYIILFIFTLIDFILFKFTKYLGVCYSCSSEYLNIKDVDLLPEFDHHQLEMYQK